MITYVQRDVATVADILHDQLVVHDDRDRGRETARLGQFGYASRHLQVSTPSPPSGSDGEPIAGRIAQIQIRTVLQHAWAEFEHDIRYKGTIPAEHASDFDRRFTLAAGLLELADHEFSTIRDRLRTEVPDSIGADPHQPDDDPRLSPRELAAFLAGQYADAGWSRTEHYAWISGLLLELGITSLAELADTLRGLDEASISGADGLPLPAGGGTAPRRRSVVPVRRPVCGSSRQCRPSARSAVAVEEDQRCLITCADESAFAAECVTRR